MNVFENDMEFILNDFLPAIEKLCKWCEDNKALFNLMKELENLTEFGCSQEIVDKYTAMIF